MGICNSTKSTKQQANGRTIKSKQAMNPKADDDKSSNENATRATTLALDANSDYLLRKEIAIRKDITEDFMLTDIVLGEGSSGLVCQGTDSSGKKYAIKRINKHNNKCLSDYVKEAEFSLNLSHEHIIKCYSIYEDLKMISFVLELAEGGDLFDFISQAPIGEIPYVASIDIIIQILDTLNYLHTIQRIVHRDVKPENFMVCIDNGRPVIKMIDFGLATFINQGKLNDYVGTPQFAAPEIISRQPYDEKVDIWSAGVVLYNMITGYEPFYSEYQSQLKEQILYKNINFDKIKNAALRSLCQGMLTRDPKKRLSALEAGDIAREIRSNLYPDDISTIDSNTFKPTDIKSICEKYRIKNDKTDKFQYYIAENKIKDFLSFESYYQIQLFKNSI